MALSNLPALFQSNATRVGCNVFAVAVDDEYIRDFNLTQPVWIATANLHKRSNKWSCILYNVCLFLTKQYGQILLTAMESYPFFIILGAKRPAKLCSLVIRTCSKQKYRHLIMRWRYVDFECLFAFIFGYSLSIFTLQQIASNSKFTK